MNAPRSRSVRITLVQAEVRPGRPAENTAAMLDRIREARRDAADLVVFSEMAVPGYLIGDEWEHEAFLRECEACSEELKAASRGLTVVFGNVAVDWKRRNEDGRVRKYNALYVADDGRFKGPPGSPYDFVIKVLLPNYRAFDDSRHFCGLRRLAAEEGLDTAQLLRPVRAANLSLGCALCEDAWDTDYGLRPLRDLASHGPDLLVNISASPFTMNKNRKRTRVFSAHAEALQRPLLYVNHTGIQNNGKTVFTFEGSSCAYDGRGNALLCGPPFEEAVRTFDLPLGPDAAPFGQPIALQEDGVPELCRALEYGIRRFTRLCGIERVVVGVSGGIDSAVVAALYGRILDGADLLLVNLPGPFTSPTTRRLAAALAANLGCLSAEIPIDEGVGLTRRQLEGVRLRGPASGRERGLELDGAMFENVQARDRSSRILAAVAAAFGGAFTCNANKSEATVGYTTLYGDLAGYFACLGDVWKTEVYDLARHLNVLAGREAIPRGSLELTPSAELSPSQNVDQGRGDPLVYPYHDRLFRSWVERWNRATPEDILEWYAGGTLEEQLGYAGRVSDLFPDAQAFVADLERWWNGYQGMGLAKRIQAPPVLAVKRRAFGFDHRESQMGPRYSLRYRKLKQSLLAR